MKEGMMGILVIRKMSMMKAYEHHVVMGMAT